MVADTRDFLVMGGAAFLLVDGYSGIPAYPEYQGSCQPPRDAASASLLVTKLGEGSAFVRTTG